MGFKAFGVLYQTKVDFIEIGHSELGSINVRNLINFIRFIELITFILRTSIDD